MIAPTNAQAISRFLKRHGFNPQSTSDSARRWVALMCSKSGKEVRVRVWSNICDETPTVDDRQVVAEIAELLTKNNYKIRYTANDYYLYVEGKEV